MSTLTLEEQAAPSTPGANKVVVYPKSDGGIYAMDDGAVEYRLTDLPTQVQGLIQANNAGDATNDLDISAGIAITSTGAALVLAAAITKQSDAAWAVGSAAGALDTGAVGNSDYYIWIIKRPDTGVVDILFSLSSTAPTMPSNYTLKKLIGWFKRVGGTIVAFHAYETEGGGIEMNWDAPTIDVNLSNTLTTSQRADAIKVPLNFSVLAHISVGLSDASSGYTVTIGCPDQTLLPTDSGSITQNTSGTATFDGWVRTSATGTISAISTLATMDVYKTKTFGFNWARRN